MHGTVSPKRWLKAFTKFTGYRLDTFVMKLAQHFDMRFATEVAFLHQMVECERT